MVTICTHLGTFHADESLAVAMLRELPEYAHADLVRLRSPEAWEAADIVVDVLGQYDGSKYFDHHQRGFEEVFGHGCVTKLLSAGLVYKHFGKAILAHRLGLAELHEDVERLYLKVYKEFVELLDANDNGVSNYPDSVEPKFKDSKITLPLMVLQLNPSWNTDPTDADYDRQFAKALELMGTAFFALVDGYGNLWLPARTIVAEAFARRSEIDAAGRVLVLERFCPWKEHLYALEKEHGVQGSTLYVLFADLLLNWRILAVPVLLSLFESRQALPEPWRGVRDEALSELTGVPGCVFVHAAGFIGGAKTREAVVALAQKALA